jgi:NADP-dependent 3-hydroxy acid dehydrogenase YdfG
MDRLRGKTVLITGATAGIGYATAIEFAKQGCNLILTGRRASRLEELKEKLAAESDVEVSIHAFDLMNDEETDAFLDEISQPIDILINNAGLSKGLDPVYEMKQSDWNLMIDTNIKALLKMSRFAARQMKERKSGHIINVGSIASHEAYPGGVVYTATKHAVKAITEATKKDLHGTGVRVGMVSPGLVETEFSIVRFSGDEEKAANVYQGMQALKAEDIAEIILFMASRPEHVNIMDCLVLPTAQSSSTMVHRDEA